jgi:glycosyltransferase involved in cell wall biosynthesis
MRICIPLHAYPPRERTGVETYSEGLARALLARGHQVLVFAPCRDRSRAHLCQFREERAGVGVTWVGTTEDSPREVERRSIPGMPAAFARFLDREQPDLVHFQHIYKLGASLIDVARERGLPVVFTGHDPFPICNDYRLLAPDLSPLDPLDHEAQARCELARGVLDEFLAAHDGFLPSGEGVTELSARVRDLLRGEAENTAEVKRVAGRITEEIRERLAVLARADRIEVPTRWLAGLLEAGGLEAPVEVRSCGIDVRGLAEIPPLTIGGGAPLSVLYLGGYYEHKGVHVLFEAVESLAGKVRLSLRGCAGSSSYATRLAETAQRVGAELGGPFHRDELPALLRAADVVVVPSLWPENAPFVIREAFAAGRPVITSDTPALRESVRNGVDGRLFPVGDAGALREILAELAADRDRLVELAKAIVPPRTIEDDARELEEIYSPLVEATEAQERRRLSRLPEHVQPFAARHRTISRMPTSELLERALAGLESLGAPSKLGTALGSSSRLRERLAEARRATAWQREVASESEQTVTELRARLGEAEAHAAEAERRADWGEERLAERESRIVWQEEVIADRRRARKELEGRLAELQRSADSLTAERDWLIEEKGEAKGRADWLEENLADREELLSWTRATLEDTRAQLAEKEMAERDRDSLASLLSRRDEELETLAADHRRLAELRALTASELDRLRSDHESLRTHESWQRAELERLAAMERELDWRAREMAEAGTEARSLVQRLVGGVLRRRIENWEPRS